MTSNGHEYRDAPTTNGHGKLDMGADRDARERKPCCHRMGTESWCSEPDGHEGAHKAPEPRELARSTWNKGKRP